MLIHLQQPKAWQGVILNGAMCGIGKFKPPWPAEHLLYLVAGLHPLYHFHAHNKSISLIFQFKHTSCSTLEALHSFEIQHLWVHKP